MNTATLPSKPSPQPENQGLPLFEVYERGLGTVILICPCVLAGEFADTLFPAQIASNALAKAKLCESVRLIEIDFQCKELIKSKQPSLLNQKVFIPRSFPGKNRQAAIQDFVNQNIAPVFVQVAKKAGQDAIKSAFQNLSSERPRDAQRKHYNLLIQGMILFHAICKGDQSAFLRLLESGSKAEKGSHGKNLKMGSFNSPESQIVEDWKSTFVSTRDLGEKVLAAAKDFTSGDSSSKFLAPSCLSYFSSLGKELYDQVLPKSNLEISHSDAQRGVELSTYMYSTFTELSFHLSSSSELPYQLRLHLILWEQRRSDAALVRGPRSVANY